MVQGHSSSLESLSYSEAALDVNAIKDTTLKKRLQKKWEKGPAKQAGITYLNTQEVTL